ncbi:MAG: hypothetical protein Q9212_006563 [Teloschistes hypoglaucus]
MPLVARFNLPQRPNHAFVRPLPFQKGLSTLSALISARNSLHPCEQWRVCHGAINALVQGFVVSTIVTTPGHDSNVIKNDSNGVHVTQQHSEGGEEEKEEGVVDYLSAIAAACDRVSRLEPCRSTGNLRLDSAYVKPRLAFSCLVRKVVAAAAADESMDSEDDGEGEGGELEFDAAVQNLLAMCAAEAM